MEHQTVIGAIIQHPISSIVSAGIIDCRDIFIYNCTFEQLFKSFTEMNFMIPHTPTSVLDEHTAIHVAELFRSFSDTSRVKIISAIIVQEQNVSSLAKAVGLSESAVSHHLRGLRLLGLVQSRRKGKEVYYSLVDEHIITLFQQGVKHIQYG
jgi:ArsR family transcriptional regulator, lead/cadmium/zinc/bismuth-responsive transcriptional repressor